MKQTFKVRLVGRGPARAWAFLPVPFSVEKVFGTKARVAVVGTLNGHPFRSSLMPEGDGTHAMMVNQALRAGAGAEVGDWVRVEMDVDRLERVVEVPPELAAALKGNARARAFFASLAYSRKKEFADWVGGAKRPETRAARAGRSVDLLEAGRKLT
jgi:hypothetical protein